MKDVLLWKYARGSWQWDVLCLLIIAFIFLTPNSWFEKKEKLATQTSRIIVQQKDFSTDTDELQRRVREISGNANATITEWREKENGRGETIYEIDIK